MATYLVEADRDRHCVVLGLELFAHFAEVRLSLRFRAIAGNGQRREFHQKAVHQRAAARMRIVDSAAEAVRNTRTLCDEPVASDSPSADPARVRPDVRLGGSSERQYRAALCGGPSSLRSSDGIPRGLGAVPTIVCRRIVLAVTNGEHRRRLPHAPPDQILLTLEHRSAEASHLV